MTAKQKQAMAIKMFGDLCDTLKRPAMYGTQDMMEWFEKKKDEFGYLLDDVYNELDHDYPDNQIILNVELHTDVEMVIV